MIRYAIPLVVSAAIASPAMAAVDIDATGPLVNLTVTESVASDPDIATVSAGVTTLAPTAVEAMSANARQMAQVIDRIESLGIDKDDIQTSGISLSPQYDWDDASRQQRFRGYQVSNRVSVKLREIERTGQVLDALVASGATDIGGIGWSVDDPTAAQEQARTAAFATAHERALAYARMAGHSGVRLLEVSESISRGGPVPMPTFDVAEARAQSTPVRPGQVETGVSITVTYEMTD